MKTSKLLTIAAAALIIGFSSCTKEKDVTTLDSDKFKVTLSLKSATTRADGMTAISGTVVDIIDGYICFVNPGNSVTDVYTITSAATLGKNIRNIDLGATPVTLSDVPGASVKVYLIANKGSLSVTPVVGSNIATYLTNNMKVEDQGDYTKVISIGEASLTATANPEVKSAAIVLSTKVARIQIKEIGFDGDITGTVAGIFINGYYPTMSLSGAPGMLQKSNNASDYVNNSAIFPSSLSGFVYDMTNKTIGATVAPNTSNGVWGYNLFASATPQIIIKLTGVTTNGQSVGDQFVTINGFKNSGTNAEIANIEGGMIYTIQTGALVIKPEHLTVDPGVTPMRVDVTVTPVTWQETIVIPNL